MRKILHIVEAFGGGLFSFLVDLINNTSDEFDIVVAYSKRNQTPENFKEYFKDNVEFIEVKNFTRSMSIVQDFRAFFELKSIIKSVKPDVIHLHSSKAGFLGRFANNNSNIKMLYNPHGFSFLMKDTSKIKQKMYWYIEKFATIKKCKIIGCSNGEYEEALKLSKNSICINNGIDVIKIEEETNNFVEKQIDFNNLKICTSGRICYQKNPELFNKIALSFPQFQFTWIGEGELREKLTAPNIKITGWKTRQEVLHIVNDNDIFILTSLWEGLPISLLESMYLKKLCLVTDSIGNKDVINDYENGFIIKSVNHFEEIIYSLNKEKYNEIAVRAKNDVIEKFSVERMAEAYKREYRA